MIDCRRFQLKAPHLPKKCPRCGSMERVDESHREYTSPLGEPVLHATTQVWGCGHISKQWWFEDLGLVLVVGLGLPESYHFEDLKLPRIENFSKQKIAKNIPASSIIIPSPIKRTKRRDCFSFPPH